LQKELNKFIKNPAGHLPPKLIHPKDLWCREWARIKTVGYTFCAIIFDKNQDFTLFRQNISKCFPIAREYELITEAHGKLSVLRNCSRSSLHVCLGAGEQLAGGGRSAVAGGGGRQTVHREKEFGAV
jgi:hypothetical protein